VQAWQRRILPSSFLFFLLSACGGSDGEGGSGGTHATGGSGGGSLGGAGGAGASGGTGAAGSGGGAGAPTGGAGGSGGSTGGSGGTAGSPATSACADGPGATYYVSPTGADSNSCSAATAQATPKQTIQAALACAAAGDNVRLLDGTYSGSGNALDALPSGAANQYITISAANDGGVILQAGLSTSHTNAWIAFRGLRFHDTTGRSILGNHLKFCGNEFKGGCPSGNCANTAVGSNDVNDTADILFEDNWWHGPGGRYNLLVYNANRVVVRRGVIRHDAGWTDTKGDPEAGLNFYNSSDSSAQNVLVIDNDLTYQSWQGAFYSVYNSASPNATNGNSFLGDIALKSPVGGGFRLDGNGPVQATVDNMVLWDTQYAAAMGSGSCKVSVTMNHITAGRTQAGSGSGFVQYASTYTGTISNVIIANVSQPTDGTSLTTFDAFGNGGSVAGTGGITDSPFTNGLSYLPRIEAGSKLAGAGIGAQVTTRIGAPGTLHGEAGWNVDTQAPLWPYPNEGRIKKEMCTDAGVTRGFCSDTSLTHYVMNVLGNGSPY